MYLQQGLEEHCFGVFSHCEWPPGPWAHGPFLDFQSQYLQFSLMTNFPPPGAPLEHPWDYSMVLTGLRRIAPLKSGLCAL